MPPLLSSGKITCVYSVTKVTCVYSVTELPLVEGHKVIGTIFHKNCEYNFIAHINIFGNVKCQLS